MWITISGWSYEGECANTMQLHNSENEARGWVENNRYGGYTKLMCLQPDGSFKFMGKI
jgi:23S rRNA C2498 (ribose-2'-O)-methylase RlmM